MLPWGERGDPSLAIRRERMESAYSEFNRKRCADRTFFGVGGGVIVGAVGGSDTCRFQSVMTSPTTRLRFDGSRSSPEWSAARLDG